MSLLSVFYKVIGAVFIVLGAVCVAEKYRTVRGGTLCSARVLRCDKGGPTTRKGQGGWRYAVEFEADGLMLQRYTNDAFWFDHSNREGSLVEIWYNPDHPDLVERKSPEAEILCGVFVALGLALIVLL